MPDYQWIYWQLHRCLIACPDYLRGYNQRDPLLAEYLINAGKTWIDNGVDDFREGQATMHLGRLSALVVRSQSPQP
jgi:hypothetical protein